MKFLGFSFSKISIERIKDSLNPSENLKISSSINLLDVREIKEHLLNTPDVVFEADFSYIVEYSPEVAKISINGKTLFSVEQKQAKEIIQNWKKKELPDDFRIPLFNVILKKSNLKALSLEEELNLPLHIPFPSLQKTTTKNN